jgi:hypothetical protein
MGFVSRCRSVFAAVVNFAAKVWSGVRWISRHLIGQWDWDPPAWLAWLANRIRANIRIVSADWRIASALVAAIVLSIGGYEWYRHRPRPHYINVTITAPGTTEWDDNGRKPPKPLLVDFAEPAAPLKSIEKPVPAGITLSPAIAGTWFWVSDKQLRFTPKDDWPVGARETIRLAKKGLLTRGALLEDYNLPFSTAPFTAKISSADFYQDPRDPSLKKVVTTLEFSHPVDTERLEKSVSLSLEKDAEYLGLSQLHRCLRQIQADCGDLHGTAGAAARRHEDDRCHRQRAARDARRQRNDGEADNVRCDPGARQPSLQRHPDDTG